MRIASRTFQAAAVMALLCPLFVEAQTNNRPNIGSVQILIREIGTRNEVARINPGETVTLPEGARVRINMMALPTGSARGPLYPATEFTDTGRGGTRITRANQENAAADLEVVASKNYNRVETIRYRITEDWVPANLRTGSFSIRVSGDTSVSGSSTGGWSNTGTTGNGTGAWGDHAVQLTQVLYQGILMREADSGAGGTIEKIRNDGFEGLVQAAVGIANSEESRTRIYQDLRVSNEQRLNALYKNLLGLDASQVSQSQRATDLSRLSNGEIARVVEDLLRSDRFRSRYAVAVR
jgi:hypothetical protein